MILQGKIAKVLCKVACVIAVVVALIIIGTASSEAVPWKGVSWYEWGGAELYVNQLKDYLEVRPYTLTYGPCAAWHTIPNDYRSASTPWMMVSFLDDPVKKSTIQLWITDNGGTWALIGVEDGFPTYRIAYWNFLNGDSGVVDTYISRSNGRHTIKLGLQGNGKLDYWFDETLILSTEKIKPKFFGEIYLITQYSVSTFVDYQTGTDYSPSVSEINVDLDIKPGGNPNNINRKSQGVTPVAVLTTGDFDAKSINTNTVTFAGASPKRWTLEDVDGDGDDDMLLHFETIELKYLDEDSTEATLVGETVNGTPIVGTDSVKMVPVGKKDKKGK